MQGWISLHRKVKEHWIFEENKPSTKFEAWIDILMMAYYKDNKKLWNNQLITVKRGQCITSLRTLAEQWKWSKHKVDNYLALLEEEGMIITQRDSRKTLLTVVKYDFYQSIYSKRGQSVFENVQKSSEKGDSENIGFYEEIQELQDSEELERGHQGDSGGTLRGHNINKGNKENKRTSQQKKSSQKIYEDESIEMNISKYLLTSIQEWNPKYKAKNIQTWCNDVRLLHSRDEQSIEDIKKVIAWATRDGFWRKNILSASKLRKQFDVLYAHMISDKEQTKSTKVVDMHALQIRKQMIGDWIASGRDPDDPAMEDWIKRGGNINELRRTNGT